jgi:hypothetical protein
MDTGSHSKERSQGKINESKKGLPKECQKRRARLIHSIARSIEQERLEDRNFEAVPPQGGLWDHRLQ